MSDETPPKIDIVVIHETLWQSILNDLCSVGFLVGAVAINRWLIDSNFLNGCIALLFVLGLWSRFQSYTKLRKTPDQAIKYIQEKGYLK